MEAVGLPVETGGEVGALVVGVGVVVVRGGALTGASVRVVAVGVVL